MTTGDPTEQKEKIVNEHYSLDLFEEQNNRLKRKLDNLRGEFLDLRRRMNSSEYRMLYFENQVLKEELAKCKRAKENISIFYENSIKIETCLQFEDNLAMNSSFFETLVFNMLSYSDNLPEQSIPFIPTVSKGDKYKALENFFSTNKQSNYKPTKHMDSTPKISLKTGSSKTSKYSEEWIRFEIFDIAINLDDFMKFHEWVVEQGVYALLLRLFIQEKHFDSTLQIDQINEVLKEIKITGETNEKFYYILHKLYGKNTNTIVTAYLPRVDVSVQAMDTKSSSFCHTYHMERRKDNPNCCDYTYVCRLKRNIVPKYITTHQTRQSLEELSVIPYAKSSGMDIGFTAANLVAMASILPNLEFPKKKHI